MTKPIENLTKRKKSGGKRHRYRGRRAYERDGYALEPVVGPVQKRFIRVRGGKMKVGLVSADVANVADPVEKKVLKVKIIRVKSSPANREYERRGVITKGSIIETELGDAKVTSRPSDDGVVNAILIKK